MPAASPVILQMDKNGAPVDSARRQFAKVMTTSVLGLTACGGGGGASENRRSDTDIDGGQDGGTNLPPRSGAFGGGQGKILFVQSGDFPQTVRLFDLATRQLRDVATIARTRHHRLSNGLTRARDGSFLVTDKISTDFRDRGWFHHCAADGTLLNSFEASTSVAEGASISPDGRRAANGATYSLAATERYETRVVITDLKSRVAREGVVLGANDEPRDKIRTPPQERTVWAPNGALYVLTRYGLFQVDPETAVVTRLHSFRLADVQSPSIAPDGAHIWFEGEGGTGGKPALWSLNIATGEAVRRVERSRTGMQYAPTLSPDGQWLLMQQVSSAWTGIGTASYFHVSALRIASAPIDAENLETRILTSAGEPFTAGGRMAWF